MNCFCGNRAPEDDLKVGNELCDTLCVGESSKTCGGDDLIQIYSIKSK